MTQTRRKTPQDGFTYTSILNTVMFVVILVAAFLYINNKLQTEKKDSKVETDSSKQGIEEVSKESPEVSTQPQKPEASNITSIDNEWNRYTNTKLEFSIDYPKNAINPQGGCVWIEGSYRPKPISIPVNIFENNNSVYIAFEYSSKLTGETSENGYSKFSGCEKKQTTLDDLSKERRTWNIVVKDVKNDQELLTFIKQRFGSSCSIGEKKSTTQPGVFSVGIEGDGKDLGATSCALNYMFVLRYSPSINKVFTFDRGQSFAFSKDEEYTNIYDDKMQESFKVLLP